mmetsp:Transcript_49170/g.107185  ORF Transcript_49170/g.107185 Transcript_49170/m.107185 type:complete len:226 (-) Transcript_49170:872-1549(-)
MRHAAQVSRHGLLADRLSVMPTLVVLDSAPSDRPRRSEGLGKSAETSGRVMLPVTLRRHEAIFANQQLQARPGCEYQAQAVTVPQEKQTAPAPVCQLARYDQHQAAAAPARLALVTLATQAPRIWLAAVDCILPVQAPRRRTSDWACSGRHPGRAKLLHGQAAVWKFDCSASTPRLASVRRAPEPYCLAPEFRCVLLWGSGPLKTISPGCQPNESMSASWWQGAR